MKSRSCLHAIEQAHGRGSVLWPRLPAWLSAPQLEDEEGSRRARIVHVIAVAVGIALGVATGVGLAVLLSFNLLQSDEMSNVLLKHGDVVYVQQTARTRVRQMIADLFLVRMSAGLHAGAVYSPATN